MALAVITTPGLPLIVKHPLPFRAMKLHYYPDTDSLYLETRPAPGTETIEVAAGLNIDVDDDGQVVGFDIGHASDLFDRSIHGPT